MLLKDIQIVRESASSKAFALKMFSLYLSMSILILVKIYIYISMLDWKIAVVIPVFVSFLSLYRAVWWIFNWDLRRVETGNERYFGPVVAIFALSIAVYTSLDLYIFYYVSDLSRHIVTFALYSSGLVFAVCVMHALSVTLIVATLTLLPAICLMLTFDTPEMTTVAFISLALVVLLIIAATSYQRAFAKLVNSARHIEQLGRENSRIASLDMLTGLPNRRHFFVSLENCLLASDHSNTRMAVGIVDLDGFKPVNDTFGHRVGDAVLAEAARRLGAASPDLCEFCRIGGDEFAFMLQLDVGNGKLNALGEALVAALEAPIEVGDLHITVGCSVGFAIYPEMGRTTDTLVEHADFALYRAKREGAGRAVIFSEEHQAFLAAQGAVERALRTANVGAEIYPVFQPLVDSGTGKAQAFECLARWDSPVLGSVSPCRFIPVAEQAGLVTQVTLTMLRKSLAQAALWPKEIGISINLSAHDIVSAAAMLRVLAVVQNSGLDPRRITFEITETALLHDFRSAAQHISMIKTAGIRVALDDFGTGCSSLSHVHALPLDELKVDRQFVSDIATNEASRNIVCSVLSLCHDMGIDCVVEGAETAEQVAILHSMGCRIVQGYYYSKPMMGQDVIHYLGLSGGIAARG